MFAISLLITGDRSTKELEDIFSCAEAKVKRMIREAKRFGADIKSLSHPDHGYRYHLNNSEDIKLVVDNWLKILGAAEDVENHAKLDNVLLNPKALIKL